MDDGERLNVLQLSLVEKKIGGEIEHSEAEKEDEGDTLEGEVQIN